ncbi:hypothetical protein FOL46_005071, partial [Perkinsus olseni]
EACREYEIDIPRVDEGILLGTGISITESELVIDCKGAERWEKVEKYLDKDETRRSKAAAFSAAGAWGHDPVSGHPQRRLQADLLRAITGKVYSSLGWHENFRPNLMSKEGGAVFAQKLVRSSGILSSDVGTGDRCISARLGVLFVGYPGTGP